MIINLFFSIIHGMTTTFIGNQDRFWGSHRWLPVTEDSDGGSSGSEDAPFGHLEFPMLPQSCLIRCQILVGSGSSKQPPNIQVFYRFDVG